MQFAHRPLLVALALLAAGCASSGEPEPLTGALPAPGFAGNRVLVFPAQLVAVPGDLDRELAFAFQGRRGTSGWVFPPELDQALGRSPGLNVDPAELPVSVFLRGDIRRIGDPLYGIIRRASAVTKSEWALIPVQVTYRSPEAEAPGAVIVLAAVVDVLSGRVRWLGTAEGEADTPDDPGGVARAMDALAAQLVPGG